jgi:hypothetical protein
MRHTLSFARTALASLSASTPMVGGADMLEVSSASHTLAGVRVNTPRVAQSFIVSFTCQLLVQCRRCGQSTQ